MLREGQANCPFWTFQSWAGLRTDIGNHGALTICLHAAGKPASVRTGLGSLAGQAAERQTRSRFARRRVQFRFREPGGEIAAAAVAWEHRDWRLAFGAVCRASEFDSATRRGRLTRTSLVA